MSEPRKKRVKPRYTDKREIMADIYSTERKINQLTTQSQALDDLAREKRRMMDMEHYQHDVPALSVMAETHEAASIKLKTSIKNLREVRLHRLGEKLAEFQTMTLPGLLPDETVECL